jgi:multisite-specific tRNA:(cytosine-C5)-methyltransferase
VWEGEPVEPPRPLSWYPEQLAWSMTTPKNVIRRSPPFASFQKFLVSENDVGNISRQEVVSMVPPLFMDIEPGMTVLDLCAAPGSKSAQLLEMVHGGEEARVRKVARKVAEENGRQLSPDGQEIDAEKAQADTEADYGDDGRSTGLLIANDVDWKRAQLLVHQVKRLNSPNFIVTNHDARHFPSILVKNDGSSKRYLKFDRILADVPCTGDGTARKNLNVWKDWTGWNAINLHQMQYLILLRALQMLKIGGRVVYSTCSMNPLENEAVIGSVIDRCGGPNAVRIVPCSTRMPDLKRRPGLRQWRVMDRSGRWWDSWKHCSEAIDAHGQRNADPGFAKLAESMFPIEEADTSDLIPLENCMRIYPHLQDTGAFFVAVLEKRAEIRQLRDPPSVRAKTRVNSEACKQEEATAPNNVDETEKSLKRKAGNEPIDQDVNPSKIMKTGEQGTEPLKAVATPSTSTRKPSGNEEYFKYLSPTHPELEQISKFYNISPRFPRDRWLVRNPAGDPTKAIYYTSELVRQILIMNEGSGMKFVHCGVKMFMKQDAQGQDICRWRLQVEGLPVIEPWIGEERVVRLYKRSTLRKLLVEMFPRVDPDGWKDLGEIGEAVRDISMGCCALRIETSKDSDGFKERMVFPLWRSLHSVNLMLPKEDRK